ncbi:GWxTD domain-containing protein [Gemmatimonadota bacterium]
MARDRSSRQVGGGVYSREVILAEDEWPDDLTALVSDFQAVPIPRGQHRIEVTVDDRNSIRRGQGEFLVEAFDTRYGEPGLGQIELLRPESAVPGESPAPAFWSPEHAGEVLASGRNPEQADCLGFLYETYRLPAESRVVYRLLNERGRAVRSRERPSPAGEAVVVRDTLGTVGLREGRYELEVNVEGVGARGFTQRRGVIVQRPLLAWGEEMEETVSQLRLYASVDQVEAFRGLEADRRRAFLAQIWLEMDPTPGTARNEYREEFERRLRYADERWASGGRRGWDSEIGRVYVAYGEPDEVREGRTVLPAQGPLDDPREARVQIWIYRDPPVSYTFIYEPDRGWMLSRDSSSPIPPTPGAPADQIHAKGRS